MMPEIEKSPNETRSRRSRNVTTAALVAALLLAVGAVAPSGTAVAQPRGLPEPGQSVAAPSEVPVARMSGEARNRQGSGPARFGSSTGRCVPGGFSMHKHWWSGRYRVDACPKW